MVGAAVVRMVALVGGLRASSACTSGRNNHKLPNTMRGTRDISGDTHRNICFTGPSIWAGIGLASRRATAREITDALNQSVEIAHSTVQTLLRQLEAKGVVSHDADERTFVFFPLIEESKVTRHATRELINEVFAGSAAGLVAYLLKNEKIPKRELDELRKLIDEK